MILRALEIIEHARVHIAKIYLGGDRSIQHGRDFIAAAEILDRAGEDLMHELANRPRPSRVRPFRARRAVGAN